MSKWNNRNIGKIIGFTAISLGILAVDYAFAGGGGGNQSVGEIAGNVTKSMDGLTKLITAVSLVAGMGFAVGAILKFKQHKDNPTQIPVGTPIALIFIAAALLFLPSIFTTLGQTIFGSKAQKSTVSGTNPFVGGGGGG